MMCPDRHRLRCLLATSDDFEKQLVSAEHLLLTTCFTFVVAGIWLTATLFMAAGYAKAWVIQRSHPSLYGFSDPVRGEAWMKFHGPTQMKEAVDTSSKRNTNPPARNISMMSLVMSFIVLLHEVAHLISLLR